MTDLFGLIETCGPVMGLLMFIIMKQIQVGAIKPRLVSIESKVDILIERTEADESNESNDSGGNISA